MPINLDLKQLLHAGNNYFYNHDPALLKDFIKQYEITGEPDSSGELLYCAVKHNNIHAIRYMLEKNKYDQIIITQAINIAIQAGSLLTLKIFFEEKNINIYSKKNLEPYPFELLFILNSSENEITCRFKNYWCTNTASYFIEKASSINQLLYGNEVEVGYKNSHNILRLIIQSQFYSSNKTLIIRNFCDRAFELCSNNNQELIKVSNYIQDASLIIFPSTNEANLISYLKDYWNSKRGVSPIQLLSSTPFDNTEHDEYINSTVAIRLTYY